MWASDHQPIIMRFALEFEDPGQGHFYFDKRMLNREGIEEIVKQGTLENHHGCEVTLMD